MLAQKERVDGEFGEDTLSTLTITSVWSLILGTGRSSMTTLPGPLKTTAFIVSFPMMSFVEWGKEESCKTKKEQQKKTQDEVEKES
jgi:hypothetical protein